MSGNIRRCGGHNFGHSELYLIDLIQKRVQELYNVLIWPKHKNVMDFKGKPNFISVGIGPLCFDEKYVEFADEPAAHLIGDLHFVAKQQGLKYPLHQVNTEREIKMYNNFMASVSKPTKALYEEWAQEYKKKSNGIDVFPKLPSMLKAYEKKWEKNMAIKATNRSLNTSTLDLLRKFWNSTTNHAAVYDTPIASRRCSNTEAAEEGNKNAEQIELTTTADPGGDDNMEFATHDDDVCDNGQEPNDETVRLFVPPAQAPSQREYIVGVDELTHQRDRKCACYPL